jgi:hypothetical protein
MTKLALLPPKPRSSAVVPSYPRTVCLALVALGCGGVTVPVETAPGTGGTANSGGSAAYETGGAGLSGFAAPAFTGGAPATGGEAGLSGDVAQVFDTGGAPSTGGAAPVLQETGGAANIAGGEAAPFETGGTSPFTGG